MTETFLRPTLPGSVASAPAIGHRRALFAGLVGGTYAVVLAAMVRILAADGLGWLDAGMVLCFALSIPWVIIGFWNSVIGLLVLRLARDPVAHTCPVVAAHDPARPVTTRTAIVMPVFNERPERVFRHLRTLVETLDATGDADPVGGAFEIFLLSDSTDPAVIAEEEARFAEWQRTDRAPQRLHYRRRADNTGHKVGNIRDFCARWGGGFDFMIVLDADSVMEGPAITRLVRVMEAHPRLGILQTLVVGLPAASPFARLFQFGMRHGLRPFATGSAWWQGEAGPYWGHNAILRLAPFIAHCRLPTLPGRPPLGGEILSHDQVEAVLMRRAGYDVRVIAEERGSYEESPPTLPDFLARELRWCQGNMQYGKLLGRPGILPLGRIQLLLAMLMYLGAPFWFGFMALGTAQAMRMEPSGVAWPSVMALFFTMLFMTFSPKILGVAEAALRGSTRRAHGGLGSLLAGLAAELLFSVLMAPVMMVSLTVFIVGLLFGRRILWSAQERDSRSLSWGEAAARFLPHTLLGLGVGTALLFQAPHLLLWAAPILTGLVLSMPFAVLTSRRRLGRAMAAIGLASMPEERQGAPILAHLRRERPSAPTATIAEPAPAVSGSR